MRGTDPRQNGDARHGRRDMIIPDAASRPHGARAHHRSDDRRSVDRGRYSAAGRPPQCVSRSVRVLRDRGVIHARSAKRHHGPADRRRRARHGFGRGHRPVGRPARKPATAPRHLFRITECKPRLRGVRRSRNGLRCVEHHDSGTSRIIR